MSLRLSSRRLPQGSDAARLRKWAFVFMTAGMIGRSIFQNAFLGMNTLNSEQMLAALDADPGAMTFLTVALLCKLTETCAVPLIAFLLVEGFQRTSGFEKYLMRVGVLALITELPYNLAMEGKLFFLGTRNPVFGLLICLVMLYFFARYEQKGFRNTAMKALIFVAAFLWCTMLGIDHGICLVIFTAILWAVRGKSNLRAMCGFCGAMACTLFDMYYIGACLSCIMLHRYNDERGEQNVKFNYAFYPAALLLCGIASKFLG